MPQARAVFVAKAFVAQEKALRAQLSETGMPSIALNAPCVCLLIPVSCDWLGATPGPGLPSIVDVEWRLDYNVNSSATGRQHDPLYIVKLKTESGACAVARTTGLVPCTHRCCDTPSRWRQGHRVHLFQGTTPRPPHTSTECETSRRQLAREAQLKQQVQGAVHGRRCWRRRR